MGLTDEFFSFSKLFGRCDNNLKMLKLIPLDITSRLRDHGAK